MVAALYVESDGVYAGLPDVDLWDEKRDARKYPGDYPVVAHPPCSRWCRLAGLIQARWGHKKGDDGGTFAAALESVRKHGGVLEHPAYSDAWRAFGLPLPRRGMWIGTPKLGYVTEVDQANYGHPARKATWLYAYGVDELPRLRWDRATGTALVSACANHVPETESRPRIMKREASATPVEFRDVLLSIARSVRRV